MNQYLSMDQSPASLIDQGCDFGNFNPEPTTLWSPWYLAGDANFHGGFPMHQDDSRHGSLDMGHYIPELSHDPHSNTFWAHDSMASQPPPIPISDSTQHERSSSIAESSIRRSSTKSEAKKRKSIYTEDTTLSPPSRRGSTRKPHAHRESLTEIDMNIQEESPPSEVDTQARKKLRERNRRAAIKVRTKKKVQEENLETAERDMEMRHRELSASVKGLTDEIHHLKMQLLQHVGCDCALIQEYITGEANRYVQDISGESAHSHTTRAS
ncbi:uncharacterized protein FIESC28_05343 [Fusarium coffeatum]|uniref:BZIP domain-containing protein n=1 Tax=Fusarium coffeatum TaxID=231269 RepID=A0A366RSM3_9HYPO|nr:uncharacterized protein FIESC28_05343 [Fusarium coffeatum]RBR20064.1 hypothetical protein FIESC28_05343 [Fusarium coffeatum]